MNTQAYFPPPWNISDNEEKTLGWCAFQDALKNDPLYYQRAWPTERCPNNAWTSLRTAWPVIEGNCYEVKDCRTDVEGTATYDGYEFHCAWKYPEKGSLLYVAVAEPTHWRMKTNES